MASPEVLGISSGAAFGVVLMLFLVPGNAFGWLLSLIHICTKSQWEKPLE